MDVSNSLAVYDSFLQNLGEEKKLEDWILELLKKKKHIRMLDIGCGKAGALFELKKKFGKKIETIGLDLVAFPKKNADQSIAGNALEEPFPKNCGLILSFRVLHEIGHANQMVLKICDALAKNGVALLAFRLRVLLPNELEWAGEMSQTDEQFLVSIAEQKTWNGCRVFGRMAWEENSTGRKTATGIFLKIRKTVG